MSVTQRVQWTIKRQQEKMHKKIEKKKNLNNGTSAILWQVGENAATVEWLLYIVTLLRIIASH